MTLFSQDRDEEDIKSVAERNAAIINDDQEEDEIIPVISRNSAILDEDDDSNEPSILKMAQLAEKSTAAEMERKEEEEAAGPAEPDPGMLKYKTRL